MSSHLADCFHAGIDWQPVGIENEMVEERILPLDIEGAAHYAAMRGIEAVDLLAHCVGVLDAHLLHHDTNPECHRGAYPDADDLWHVAQQHGSPPAADRHVALLGRSAA